MPSKRKRSGDSENADDSKRYAYLNPSIRRVPEKTIKAKWSTLPEPVQDKVRDLFHSLERPVIVRQQNEKKRIEAQSAVNAVRSLEVNLATMKDSIDLLKAEIAKEEALLADEKKSLQEMDKNAKRAEAERKRQTKNEHPVLRQLDELPQIADHATGFSLLDTTGGQAGLEELDADPVIQKLMNQLHGHLQSMQSNIAPMAGLSDAITRSQAALDHYSMSND
ncbi:CENP-A-nucleosome distal centromere subunit CENP-Q [Penicillium maclennaniae]|uniref:CENP-A-nucleosome distal centromere subunit CENP-Q n=1 Tax=Penicillium maclennaniae TaxID=1343394 RepID=UPI00254071F9|nr:CENP-A-nucleosome distal centromere subunit CENP-Q [Penicillium maclennaniae]KAJ5666372.1 CENP-A-nucleosome distal centromere subunit CENP-Q [Penicillium maclennaniae]